MALDHSKLQLLFNVIAITAATSLTLIWYLRKRDRETLVNRMTSLRQAAAARAQPAKSEEEAPDIRQFVSRQATGWVAPSVAQWNQRLTSNGEPAQRPAAEQKELPRSQGIVFPRREASGGHSVPRLAGPVGLQVRAAKFGRLSC